MSSRLTQQLAQQALQQAQQSDAAAIANLVSKTQGLSYENNVAGLQGPSGGFLSGEKKALSWDAQGNIVVEGNLQLGGLDLQSILDGKQQKGDYALKGDLAAFQPKGNYQAAGDYVTTPEYNKYKASMVEYLKRFPFDNSTPKNWTGANFKRRDGRWTHFDWKDDQKNYIRGNLIVDDDTYFGKNIDIGGNLTVKGQPLVKPSKCVNKTTVANDWGGGNSIFLDRHNVQCDDNQILTGFQLYRPTPNQIAYKYKCCSHH